MTDEVRKLEEMSDEELKEQFDEECGIKFCTYCGKPLSFTREQLIEFLDGGCLTVECCRTYLWGDF